MSWNALRQCLYNELSKLLTQKASTHPLGFPSPLLAPYSHELSHQMGFFFLSMLVKVDGLILFIACNLNVWIQMKLDPKVLPWNSYYI